MARTLHAARPAPSSNSEVAPSVVSLSAPKRRRPSWVVFGIVLTGLAMLLGLWVFSVSSQRVSVMVAARDIEPGEVITATDLRVVEVADAGGLRAVQSSQQGLLVGLAARSAIPEGTVMNTGLVTGRDQVIPVGQVVVGAALEPGAAPTGGLSPGDRVDVIAVVKSTGSPVGGDAAAQVLTSGTVWSVERSGTGSSTSKLVVSLLVPAEAQTSIAQAAADGRLRLSLVGVPG